MLVVAAAALATTSPTPDRVNFDAFVELYAKTYATAEERSRRQNIYDANTLEIKRLNAQNPGAVFGVNGFADLSPEEFRTMYTLNGPPPSHNASFVPVSTGATAPIPADPLAHYQVLMSVLGWKILRCWFKLVFLFLGVWRRPLLPLLSFSVHTSPLC